MSLTISNISPVLKKMILPIVEAQVSKKVILLDQVKKNVGVEVINDNIYIAVRTAFHSGFYSPAEGTEPRVGKSTYAQPVAPMKYNFSTVEFTDQALSAASAVGPKSVAKILTTEIESARDTAKKHGNRILHGAGTGKLCQTNGAQGGGGSATLTVDGCPSSPASGGNHTKYLAPGQYISIAGATAVQILTVDSKTQVTLTAVSTWADDAVITLADASEPMGLAGIIDDGDNVATFQNILRSANPWANAQTDDTSEALSEADMIDRLIEAREYGDGPNMVLMGKTMWVKYGSLLTSMKRTTEVKPVLSGGWKGLEFMDGVPVLWDPDTWEGYVQMPNTRKLTIAQGSSMLEWLEADAMGGILRRSPTNRANWEGTMKWYFNFVGRQVNDSARLSGKTA